MTNDPDDSRDSDDHRDSVVTALVVVRPARSGRTSGSDRAVSRENLADVAPSDDDVRAVSSAMADLGFEVGPFGGIAMAVTAPIERVEDLFGIVLRDDSGHWAVTDLEEDLELPVDALAATTTGLVERIERIVVEAPTELHGGGSWSH